MNCTRNHLTRSKKQARLQFSQAAAQFVVLTAEMGITEWGGPRRDLWKVRCVVGTNSWQMDGEFLEGANQV